MDAGVEMRIAGAEEYASFPMWRGPGFGMVGQRMDLSSTVMASTLEDEMDTWRTLGDTTLETYRAEFARIGSPMLGDAAAIHTAARPHSALALAMMFHEKKYDTVTDTIPASFRNPLAVAKPDGGGGTRPLGGVP